jgi:hypothetical protein
VAVLPGQPSPAGEATVSEPAPTPSPYLTAREAAAYLGIAYSTFRARARHVRRVAQTRRYTSEALDEYAHKSKARRVR